MEEQAGSPDGGLEGDSTQCPFSPKPKLPTGVAAISLK